jgi:hypothetical protein
MKLQTHLEQLIHLEVLHLQSVTPTSSGTTALCDFSDVSFTSASFTANGALIYNDTESGDLLFVQ